MRFWRPKSLWRDFMTLPYKGSSSVGFDPNHCLTDGDCVACTSDQRNSGSQETLQPRTENHNDHRSSTTPQQKIDQKDLCVLKCQYFESLVLDIFGYRSPTVTGFVQLQLGEAGQQRLGAKGWNQKSRRSLWQRLQYGCEPKPKESFWGLQNQMDVFQLSKTMSLGTKDSKRITGLGLKLHTQM